MFLNRGVRKLRFLNNFPEKNSKKLIFVFLLVIPLLGYSACVSLMEKTGKALDGSAGAEKKIARYRMREKEGAPFDMEITHAHNKAGQNFLIITQNKFPAFKIRTTEPDAEGKIYISSIEYISGNTAGWNQYSLEFSGSGSCFLKDTHAVFSFSEDIGKVQITQGKIRLYESTLIGNQALTNLRNRSERIDALTEWMKNNENAPYGLDRGAFVKYWKPILFPETCSKRKRPANWQEPDDKYHRAESIKWNTGYSVRTFPEELRPVRDSGTLFRDWEEAFEWIYGEYEWETFISMFSREASLRRIK